MSQRMNYKPFFIVTILLSFTLSCTNKSASISPETKNITESIYASGFIKSLNQYEVFGRASGTIEKVFIEEGMPVKIGDPIFQLENKNLRLATENARLASSDADYKNNINRLSDAKQAIDLAKKKLINDSLLFQRQKNLWSKQIGSKIEFEKMELNYENSKLNLANAISRYDDLNRQLSLASKQSKNNLEIAKILEDEFIIRSEIDGVIYKINKKEGELINGQEPAAVVGTKDFIIELDIDEFDIVKIKKGQQVIIRMDSYKSEVFEARIIAIDPMMNKRTRSFQAEAVFTKKPSRLFPNLTVEANIVINTKQNALTIPRNYLVNDSLVKLKGGILKKVETGLMDYELVEIVSGIDKSTIIELPQE